MTATTARKKQQQQDLGAVAHAMTAPPPSLRAALDTAWGMIVPAWPLRNLIAVNPLAGFEDRPFENAVHDAAAYFQRPDMPDAVAAINRDTIKWLQVFCDDGQAAIAMPGRGAGLFAAVMNMLPHDDRVTGADARLRAWIAGLPRDADAAISECLFFLGVSAADKAQFLTLMLTTLPGWAAYVKYRTAWADAADAAHPHPITQSDYMALRLVLACVMWPRMGFAARDMMSWHDRADMRDMSKTMLDTVTRHEKQYQKQLWSALNHIPATQDNVRPDAQFVFCIDVRSEPFRRALEAQGRYDTFGFAGFFGLPVGIQNTSRNAQYPSCPVLLKPAHILVEGDAPQSAAHTVAQGAHTGFRRLYHTLKYTAGAPFSLVDIIGPFSGVWMLWRNVFPRAYAAFTRLIHRHDFAAPCVDAIPADQRARYAAGALRGMGMTRVFAPVVVLCGHGSETQNNAYGTALDCGACGGHRGAPNARALASMLNDPQIRRAVAKDGLIIPDDTVFIGAEHNTTTDDVTLFDGDVRGVSADALTRIRADLDAARLQNTLWRSACLDAKGDDARTRAGDWAQVRPEWGLAGNAAFIVGPRALTRQLNLEGRSFLHSYDWTGDADDSVLTLILTAPMVVAQWINTQYLFSTLDNVAYGGGSKVAQNVTGKIGIMQGNASDLMNGLPLQSVFKNDTDAYHAPARLMTVVYAPRDKLDRVIAANAVLTKLFGNGWVTLACIDPATHDKYILNRDFTWARPV